MNRTVAPPRDIAVPQETRRRGAIGSNRPGDRAGRPGGPARRARRDRRPERRRLGRRRRLRRRDQCGPGPRPGPLGRRRAAAGQPGDADPGHARRRRRGADRGLARRVDSAVPALVALAVVALVLDAVDGWVARRTGTTSPLGARFDMEVDAFLILVLSVYVAPSTGAVGARDRRDALRVRRRPAGCCRGCAAPPPPRYWCKVVAAIQGIVLTVAAADVLPAPWTDRRARRLAGAARRVVRPRGVVAVAPPAAWRPTRSQALEDHRARVRARSPRGATTAVAGLLVWFALVAPDQAQRPHARAPSCASRSRG